MLQRDGAHRSSIHFGRVAEECEANAEASSSPVGPRLPSGKLTYGKSLFLWAIFHSYVSLPEGRDL